MEVVLREDSFLIGRTAFETKLRNRFNVNLVAVSRKGISSVVRLKSFRFKAGDILLMQVPVSILQDTYSKLRCLPLAERGGVGMDVGNSKKKTISTISYIYNIYYCYNYWYSSCTNCFFICSSIVSIIKNHYSKGIL